MNANDRCTEGGAVHAWQSRGLDVVAHGQRETTCSIRRCVWCGVEQKKPYGARRGSWSPVREAAS